MVLLKSPNISAPLKLSNKGPNLFVFVYSWPNTVIGLLPVKLTNKNMGNKVNGKNTFSLIAHTSVSSGPLIVSVFNILPESSIYTNSYIDIFEPDNKMMIHFMGIPTNIRHIIMRYYDLKFGYKKRIN